MIIKIENKTKQKNIPNNKRIINWIKNITRENIKLNIIVLKKKDILLLNKKYKNKQKTTDVLSFKHEINSFEKKYIGDIYLCANIIERYAKKQHKKYIVQWCETIVHGILHLMNYKHKLQKEFIIMKNLENKILKYIFYKK